MTSSPKLPSNLDHLKLGHRVWFYPDLTVHARDQAPMHGVVIGRGQEPETRIMSLTIAPHNQHKCPDARGGVIRRAVYAVFPDRESIDSYTQFLSDGTPEEIYKFTKSMIELTSLIAAIPQG